MIKVLVIESTVFGHDGITNVIVNYYKYLDHKNIDMDLVTINPVSQSFKLELKKNNNVNYILPYRNSNPIKYVNELCKIIKNEKYSVVHVHGCSSTMAVEMLAAKLAGVNIRIAHSHNTKCNHVKVDKLLRPFFSKWCNVGFACGKEAGEWMFPNKDFSIISNGIDLEKYQFDLNKRYEMRNQYDLDGKFVIGHVGRFSQQKNHEKLISVFEEVSKKISNTKLVLVGDGELRKTIEEKVAEKELDVLFVGLSDEVDKWLQAMDIMVFPSLFEGLPLGLIEAQASGLPCLLSNTISPDTKITDLVEFIELSESSTAWCDRIIKLKGKFDREKRVDLIKSQIRKAHFDIKQNCKELTNKYQQLLEDGGK